MQSSRDIKKCLDKLLDNNDTVFIVPHNRPDMDAIGASIGMSLICNKKGKRNYIVIDDDVDKLESVTKKVIGDIGEYFKIIKASDINSLITSNSLMIAVDVNKDYLVSTKPYLNRFNNIFIIDHHKIDENTIKTKYLFVDDKLSSACEEVSRLVFLNNVQLTDDEANYLLAGIVLDTNKLNMPNVSPETLSVVSKLASEGADLYYTNNMFIEDFEHDRAIQRLVDNTGFINYGFAVCCDKDNSNNIYEIEDIAKAADYLLKYQVNATFVIARISQDTVSISARSKGIIDVSKIMKIFGGGGNEHSAAARISGKSIDEIKNKLLTILTPTMYLDKIDFEKEEKGPRLMLVQ